MSRIRPWAALAAALLILLSGVAFSQEAAPTLTPVTAQTESGTVTYPRLDGHPDAVVQAQVNQAILAGGEIQNLLETLNSPSGPEPTLNAGYEATLQNDVLSILLTHQGPDRQGKEGQGYATVNYDLRTGQPLTLNDLFTDVEGAVAAMEAVCLDRVAPNVSTYLENSEVTPLPREAFYLTADAITFYYPARQLAYFSGYCGSVSFFYYELADFLNLQTDSPLARLGAGRDLEPQGDTAARVEAAVSAGTLPGMAPRLGDSLRDWLDAYRLLCDPDYYPGGRFFQMEAGEMRDIWLLTDALTQRYDTNRVLGIRADRVNLYGIQPGKTSQAQWRGLLGEPQSSVSLDEESGMDYYLPAGVSDYYTYGEHMLRLHCNEEGVLVSVQVLD